MKCFKFDITFLMLFLISLSGLLMTSCQKAENEVVENPEITIPIIDFTYSPFNIKVGDTVLFQATEKEGSAEILSWQWHFDDSASSVSAVPDPSFTFAKGGGHDVRLIGTDSAGNTAQIIRHLTVKGEVKPLTIPLKVMIYCAKPSSYPNVDYQKMADIINSYKPDLVLLRQVDSSTTRSKGINVPALLAEMTHMDHSYFSNFLDYQGGGYGNAVLSRFPIVDSSSVLLPPAPGQSGSVHSMAVITIELNDSLKLVFAGTELDNKNTNESRIYQTNQIITILKDSPYPVILAGDFNTFIEASDVEDSPTFTLLKSIFTPGCNGGDCSFNNPVKNPTRAADYILFNQSDKFEVKEYKALNETTSSLYLPIVAELEYKP